MTSKCGKNKEVAHEPQASVSLMFWPHFWRLLWSITEQTHGNMESICFIQWSEKKKTYTHTCLVPLDCSRICASLGNFSQTLLFVSASSFFVILIAYSFLEEFFKVFSCSTHGENILQNRESLVAMTHDGNCCEDFLWFRHSEVVKNSFASISPFFFFVNSFC